MAQGMPNNLEVEPFTLAFALGGYYNLLGVESCSACATFTLAFALGGYYNSAGRHEPCHLVTFTLAFALGGYYNAPETARVVNSPNFHSSLCSGRVLQSGSAGAHVP